VGTEGSGGCAISNGEQQMRSITVVCVRDGVVTLRVPGCTVRADGLE
jgi:hypothetical protein